MARNGLVLEVTSGKDHFVKSVQIRSFFLVRMQENTDLKKLHIWTLFTQWIPNIFGNSIFESKSFT